MVSLEDQAKNQSRNMTNVKNTTLDLQERDNIASIELAAIEARLNEIFIREAYLKKQEEARQEAADLFRLFRFYRASHPRVFTEKCRKLNRQLLQRGITEEGASNELKTFMQKNGMYTDVPILPLSRVPRPKKTLDDIWKVEDQRVFLAFCISADWGSLGEDVNQTKTLVARSLLREVLIKGRSFYFH